MDADRSKMWEIVQKYAHSLSRWMLQQMAAILQTACLKSFFFFFFTFYVFNIALNGPIDGKPMLFWIMASYRQAASHNLKNAAQDPRHHMVP